VNKVETEERVLRLNSTNEEKDQFIIFDDESGISNNMSLGIVQFMMPFRSIVKGI
jgi:hypothetical protein